MRKHKMLTLTVIVYISTLILGTAIVQDMAVRS
jgi:hypothetical protein